MKAKPIVTGVLISAGGVFLAGLAMAYLRQSVGIVAVAHSGYDS